ncbi:MAG: histidine kinase dimerization/phosphoacceptor domain -containing protein [Euryarchaeota archaeon]|nr:histidine kinase dimerization/phosphoacceptor domain -containing protein [Euryarchaeota archaeon]
MNIRTKFLVVMLSLVLITGMTAILIGRTVSTSIIEEQVSTNLETTAQSRANHIGTVLGAYNHETGTLSVGASFRNIVDKRRNRTHCIGIANLRINNTIQAHEDISGIRILDKNGTVVASRHVDTGSEDDTSEIFRIVDGEVRVTDLRTSVFTGDDVVSAATPILVDGEFSGVVIVDFDARKIFEIATDMTGLGVTGEIYILNEYGYIITPSRFSNDTIPTQDIDLGHFVTTVNHEPEAALYKNYRGADVLGAHAPIPAMNWCLVAEIEEAEAFAPVTRLTTTMFSVLAGLLLIGAVICVIVSGTIAKPIVKLQRGAEEIMNGNLDYKVGTGTGDEVGELSRAFDTMTANLKESGRALEGYSRGLEKKVEERTARLDELLTESEQQRVAISNMLADVTETKDDLALAGVKLKQKSEEQRALLSTIPAFVYFKDRDGNYVATNNAFADLVGISVDEIAGKTDYELFPDEQAASYIAYDQKIMESGEPGYDIEELNAGADGEPMWFSSSKTPFFDSDGIVIGMVGMTLDITERKKAEDQIKASLAEKVVLLREIHHRVKNNLQVVSSLLNMQARGAKNEDSIDILTESRNRINAMALIHAQLYESSNLSEINLRGFVNKLLVQLLQTYPIQGTQIKKTISIADYPVPISLAVPVGLIVNELLSNTLKHAFIGRKEGEIKVRLTASEEGRINLTVSDNGVGLPPGFDIDKTGTLGLRLIKILTEDQLEGTLKVISKEGTTFDIEFDVCDSESAVSA